MYRHHKSIYAFGISKGDTNDVYMYMHACVLCTHFCENEQALVLVGAEGRVSMTVLVAINNRKTLGAAKYVYDRL